MAKFIACVAMVIAIAAGVRPDLGRNEPTEPTPTDPTPAPTPFNRKITLLSHLGYTDCAFNMTGLISETVEKVKGEGCKNAIQEKHGTPLVPEADSRTLCHVNVPLMVFYLSLDACLGDSMKEDCTEEIPCTEDSTDNDAEEESFMICMKEKDAEPFDKEAYDTCIKTEKEERAKCEGTETPEADKKKCREDLHKGLKEKFDQENMRVVQEHECGKMEAESEEKKECEKKVEKKMGPKKCYACKPQPCRNAVRELGLDIEFFEAVEYAAQGVRCPPTPAPTPVPVDAPTPPQADAAPADGAA